MSIGRDDLTKAETLIIAAIEGGVPSIVEARGIIADFQIMIRRRGLAQLPSWLERTAKSLVASFGNGVKKGMRPRFGRRQRHLGPMARLKAR